MHFLAKLKSLPKGMTALLMAVILVSCGKQEEKKGAQQTIKSPDGNITAFFSIDAQNRACYSVKHNGKTVIDTAQLGVVRSDGDFSENLKLKSVSETETVKDQYTLLHGKQDGYSYNGHRKVFTVENDDGQTMDIIFQVSDDGVAFRYNFTGASDSLVKVEEEVSAFHFPDSTRAWLQPVAVAKSGYKKTNPSFEEFYKKNIPVGTEAPTEVGWAYPALFKLQETWMLVSETSLDSSYCGTRLRQKSAGGIYRVGFPMEEEVIFDGELVPQNTLPYHSPWRVITIGSLETIVESSLGTDLAEPKKVEDTSWIKPGRSSWSWVMLKDDSTIYPVQKRFIDYAADMGWEYTLVDAYWDKNIGYDSVQKLIDYGQKKGVDILLWYNSAGDWNEMPMTPRNKLLTHESRTKEFEKVSEMGAKGLKIDFFGGDGQSVINYYINILEDAASYNLNINFHGATIPRGWHRTYPHLMTMESVKGMEYVTFDQENEDRMAKHSTMLPFTRNVYDPMDFTPVTLYTDIPDIERKTTNAFQLATPILFLSGIQHYAATPSSMEKAPGFVKQLLKEIPVSWDETQFVDGFPGKRVVIARRKDETWYVAGINGEKKDKNLTLDLPFVDVQQGYIINDGGDLKSFEKSDVTIENQEVGVSLNANSGFVMVFEE